MEAFAKINLGLCVRPRDASGYHPIDTVYASVAVADEVQIAPSPGDGWHLEVRGPWPLFADSSNSITQAQAWLCREYPSWPRGWRIAVTKKIPPGAGLAGGSADAAAFLRFAADAMPAWAPRIAAQAFRLGMDVPFHLVGKVARGRGYGQILQPLWRYPDPLWAVLANPGFEVSTQAVYAAFDHMVCNPGPSQIDGVVDDLARNLLPEHLGNDLESAACTAFPALADFRIRIEGILGPRHPVWLSGSGATYYFLTLEREEAEWVADRLRRASVPWVAAARVAPEPDLGAMREDD